MAEITNEQILKAWNDIWTEVPEVKPENGCPKCQKTLTERKVWERASMAYIVTYVCDECGFIGYDPRPNYQAALLEWMCNQ